MDSATDSLQAANADNLDKLSLTESSKLIDDILHRARSEIVATSEAATAAKKKLETLQFVALSIKSREFYELYGEWDWIVREKYIDLVKSASYTYPISEDALGYAFELWNFTPRYFKTIGAEIKPEHVTVGSMMSAVLYTATEFVKPAFIKQCAITPKILAAFQLLKLFPQTGGMERGFKISVEARAWSEIPDPDCNGYKVHLSSE